MATPKSLLTLVQTDLELVGFSSGPVAAVTPFIPADASRVYLSIGTMAAAGLTLRVYTDRGVTPIDIAISGQNMILEWTIGDAFQLCTCRIDAVACPVAIWAIGQRFKGKESEE